MMAIPHQSLEQEVRTQASGGVSSEMGGQSVTTAFVSKAGRRPANEDRAIAIRFTIPGFPPIVLTAVADGMGGKPGGELAAKEAIHGLALGVLAALEELSMHGNKNLITCMREGFEYAHLMVRACVEARPELEGMGTTLVSALSVDGIVYVAGVGDSRVYLVRNGLVEQVTRDDSMVQSLVDAGVISESEAERHPRANELTAALGWAEAFPAPEVAAIPVLPGDLLVLCSDGLWKDGQTALQGIGCATREHHFTEQFLQELAEGLSATALECGADDNITVALLYVSDGAAATEIEAKRTTDKED